MLASSVRLFSAVRDTCERQTCWAKQQRLHRHAGPCNCLPNAARRRRRAWRRTARAARWRASRRYSRHPTANTARRLIAARNKEKQDQKIQEQKRPETHKTVGDELDRRQPTDAGLDRELGRVGDVLGNVDAFGPRVAERRRLDGKRGGDLDRRLLQEHGERCLEPIELLLALGVEQCEPELGIDVGRRHAARTRDEPYDAADAVDAYPTASKPHSTRCAPGALSTTC